MLTRMRSFGQERSRTQSDTWAPLPPTTPPDNIVRAHSDCTPTANMTLRKARASVQEVHVAILGMNGSGKSALTVKYITRRFITEYDPLLEDTYCKHDILQGQEVMVWLMDTVEGPKKDPARYLSWADVFVVVYSITSSSSFDYARDLLRTISAHDHGFCPRPHHTFLLGNKIDLDRYRQVSKTQGARLADEMKAEFFELNTTEEYVLVKNVFHHAIHSVLQQRSRLSNRSPSPKSGYGASDSDCASSSVSLRPSPKSSATGRRPVRSKSPAAKSQDQVKPPTAHPAHASSLPAPMPPPKKTSGLRLFKLFNQ